MKQTSGNNIPQQYQEAIETALWKIGKNAELLYNLNAEWNPDNLIELDFNGLNIRIKKK